MVDLRAVTVVLGGIKTATEIGKLLRSSTLSLAKAEMNLRVTDLTSARAEAQIALADLQAEIIQRDQRIRALEDAADTAKRVRYEAPYYWLMQDEGSARDGPFRSGL